MFETIHSETFIMLSDLRCCVVVECFAISIIHKPAEVARFCYKWQLRLRWDTLLVQDNRRQQVQLPLLA